MSARSKRLVGPVRMPTSSTALVLLGTVPAGKTWLLKSIRAVSTGGSAHLVYLYKGSGGTWETAVGALSIPTTGQFIDPDTDGLVLQEGETLYANCGTSTSTPPTLTISGAELVA